MTLQRQEDHRPPTKRDAVAFPRCIPVCDHSAVTDYDPETEAAALSELDALTEAFRQAEAAFEAARERVQEAIVRHLRERNAAPGKIAAHSPYDRNHVRRLGDAAGIPPLRTPTVRAVKRASKKAS